MFQNRGNKSGKTGFGEGLVEAGLRHPELICLGADITASVSMDGFRDRFPDRFFSIGIAEQNLAGVAAGLALGGKIPFFSTYAAFASLRPADQIRVSICYNRLNVKIGGAHAGISVGPDGATHQALEDVAFMRALPGMTVLSPCDAAQVHLAVLAAVEQVDGPVYIRFGREPVPDFSLPQWGFVIGRAQRLSEGFDLSIAATGHLVWEALQAAFELRNRGIHARVINFHTIKPLDKGELMSAALETGAIVTAEEHQIAGGFGSAVAEFLVSHCPVPVQFVGMNDCFGESGPADSLMSKFEMTRQAIVRKALHVLALKAGKNDSTVTSST